MTSRYYQDIVTLHFIRVFGLLAGIVLVLYKVPWLFLVLLLHILLGWRLVLALRDIYYTVCESNQILEILSVGNPITVKIVQVQRKKRCDLQCLVIRIMYSDAVANKKYFVIFIPYLKDVDMTKRVVAHLYRGYLCHISVPLDGGQYYDWTFARESSYFYDGMPDRSCLRPRKRSTVLRK